jgi:xylulokinase
MSLLGIDVGTTGCKSGIFSETGELLALAYREYDHVTPKPGWGELDPHEVWAKVQETIREVASKPGIAPIQALAVTSLGEAVVPVRKDRQILGPSILNYDTRGYEYGKQLSQQIRNEDLYPKTGNIFGTYFSMVKLMWIKKNQPELYEQTDYFMPWSGFISFMLGSDPAVDFSLANRTLLFDIKAQAWSDELLRFSGIDREKLPKPVQAGTLIGHVPAGIAKTLNLPEGLPIVMGTHDQCANAVGSGAINAGQAMLGMGTFTTIVPVFTREYDPKSVIELGVNTEHHAVPGRYVSFIYNQGGSVVKWFRDTFAAVEKQQADAAGEDIYTRLFNEVPNKPGSLVLLPYLTTTGLPHFSPHTSGVISGLRLTSTRGEILQGIIESILYDLKMTMDPLKGVGLNVEEYITVGGGSKSDVWMQTVADVLGCPVRRMKIAEAGVLGCAIIAGVGSGVFQDYPSAIEVMVSTGDGFEPKPENVAHYQRMHERFMTLRGLLQPFLEEHAVEILE